ncbi:MAG: 4Fe-4S dicluster domain-containing protein [Eubacterium sp.]
MIEALRTFYKDSTPVDCTGCRYCTECPKIIPIPSIFKYYNEAHMYGDIEAARQKYRTNIKNKFKANNCIGCGDCEAHCPQHLNIRDFLKDAHDFFTS